MIDIDSHSRLVSVSGRVRFRELEAALSDAGLTLGLLHDSDAHVGQRLLAGSPSDRSPRYGRLTDACLGIEIEDELGTSYVARPVPRRAAGPDWRSLLASLPRLHVSRAILRIHARPESRMEFSYEFPDRSAALAAAFEAVRLDVTPASWQLRISTLSGRLEGVRAITATEKSILDDLAERLGGRFVSSAASGRPFATAGFVRWSQLRSSCDDTAEMCLDGGLLLGWVPPTGRGLELRG